MTVYQILIGGFAAELALAIVVVGSVAAGLAAGAGLAAAIRGRRGERKEPEDRYEMDLGA